MSGFHKNSSPCSQLLGVLAGSLLGLQHKVIISPHIPVPVRKLTLVLPSGFVHLAPPGLCLGHIRAALLSYPVLVLPLLVTQLMGVPAQSISQQSINPSFNQSINQLVGQSINRPISQSVSLTVPSLGLVRGVNRQLGRQCTISTQCSRHLSKELQ